MLSFLLAGITFGLSAGFSPGPLFALVISQTLTYGLKEGIKTAFAPVITDVPIIILSLFLVSELAGYRFMIGWISIVGGLFLTYLAYQSYHIKSATIDIAAGGAKSVRKSALVNFLSPNPYLFWISVGSPIILQANSAGTVSVVAFLTGFYICLIGGKIMVGVLAYSSQGFFKGRSYVWLMRFLGALLLIYAFVMLHGGWLLLNGYN